MKNARGIKKTTLLVLALTMALSCISLAAAEETAPVGYYEYTKADFGGAYTYFHFYDNGVFYAFNMASPAQAGTFEVVDGEFSVTATWTELGETEDTVHTTPKGIRMTSFSGEDLGTFAFHPEENWIANEWAWNSRCVYNPDRKGEDYIAKCQETGIAVHDYALPGEPNSDIKIMHNGAFEDYTGDLGYDGTWTAEGGVYTLTSEDVEGAYTLTLAEGGKATLVRGEETVELEALSTKKARAEAYHWSGVAQHEITKGYTAEFLCDVVAYDDATLEGSIKAEAIGVDYEVTGNWSRDEATGDVTVYLSVPNTTIEPAVAKAEGNYSFEFVMQSSVGDIAYQMTLPVEDVLSASDETTMFALTLRGDKTAALSVPSAGIDMAAGTWAFANFGLTVSLENIEGVTAYPNSDTREITLVIPGVQTSGGTMDLTFVIGAQNLPALMAFAE